MTSQVAGVTSDVSVRIDPVLLGVLQGRFDSIANEMETTLLKSSYSPLIKESLDATAALFDASGRTIAQAEALPAHLGVLITSLRRVASAYSGGIARDGDVYIMNDPYDGGTHLPDLLIAIPIFHNSMLVGYAATLSHHQDVGGSAPGSTAPDAVDLAAEGFRIPLMKLFDNGTPNDTLFALLRSNGRMPDNLIGDLEAQLAACRTGALRFGALCDERGVDTVIAGSAHLMDYADRLTRNALARLPNGEFTAHDYLDDDGVDPDPIEIKVKVTIHDSKLHVDLTGSSRQVKGAINCVEASTLSAIYCVVRQLAGPEVPSNDGCYRAVTATLPEGSIVNASFPAPVGCRVITMKRVVDTLYRALADALPDTIPAASSGQSSIMYVGGTDVTTGRPYVGFLGIPQPGGTGGRPGMDGIDVTESDVTNNMQYPAESCEAELPMRILSVRLWEDSGGPGEYRGGLGYLAEIEWLGGDAHITIRRDRHVFVPWGLAGGHSAPKCRAVLRRPDGTEIELPSKRVFTIRCGDVFKVWTTGGGGYGDPLDRKDHRVLEDVLDGRVSRECAEAVYGVVVEEKRIDGLATARLRSNLRRHGREALRGPA